ncbi:MAG: hypothetical protein P8L43_04640, partial [Candidatus Marinimicrobia bacterium]|nr:hypothetical protein [Candidatus Neomarinimicrobiota bacterium]
MKSIKKIFLTITAVAFASFSFSQQLSRYVVASGGNYSTASGISVSSTIGEPMVNTLTATGFILTQGFQQASITYGCTDSTACNYDASATIDDGSCILPDGCTDSTAFNYDPLAMCDDGSCIAIVYGCTDPLALNYYPGANVNDPGNPCCYVAGCTDPLATNYDPNACIDDGNCTYVGGTCGAVTGVNLTDLIHDRVQFNWDDMNDSSCVVDQIRIQYSDDGGATYSLKTMGAPVGNN